jgi:Bifunctional DNA primase/polymerase, N-terminal/Primase C terminal 2 (PriCT-2)
MSAQQQTPPAGQPAENVIPFPGGALAGCENWPNGCVLITARDGNGQMRLRPPIDAAEQIDFHETNRLKALQWAAAGDGVFPVFPCHLIWNAGQRKVKKPPATGLGGFKHATTDSVKIRQMWDACSVPGAVVGLHTLHVLAVDTDLEHPEARRWQAENARRLEETYGYYTRAGRHSLYLQPPGHPTKRQLSKITTGVDILGTDAYVILWEALGFEVFTRPGIGVMPCPDWLTTILQKLDEPRVTPAGEKSPEIVSDTMLQLRAHIVGQIHNDDRFRPRENWIKVLAAIRNAFASDPGLGYELWIDFCNRWNGPIDPEAGDLAWDSFIGPEKTGFGTILYYAKEDGVDVAAYRAAEKAEKAKKLADMPLGGIPPSDPGGKGDKSSGGDNKSSR